MSLFCLLSVPQHIHNVCLSLFFVALAKYLGVNITAQKYEDSAQVHKNAEKRMCSNSS